MKSGNNTKNDPPQSGPKVARVTIKVASTQTPSITKVTIFYHEPPPVHASIQIGLPNDPTTVPVLLNSQNWNAVHIDGESRYTPKPGTNPTTDFPVRKNPGGQVNFYNAVGNIVISESEIEVDVSSETD